MYPCEALEGGASVTYRGEVLGGGACVTYRGQTLEGVESLVLCDARGGAASECDLPW